MPLLNEAGYLTVSSIQIVSTNFRSEAIQNKNPDNTIKSHNHLVILSLDILGTTMSLLEDLRLKRQLSSPRMCFFLNTRSK